MADPTGARCPPPGACQLHARFLSILPRIQAHAEIHFRHLRCPGRREDAIAEVVALAWKWFLRLTQQQKDVAGFVSAVADFAVRHVRSGRRLCGQERGKDAMSPVAQRLHGFRVEPLTHPIRQGHDGLFSDPHGQDVRDAFEERLRDNTQAPVIDQVVFRCDFPAWLATLSARNRQVVAELMAGERTGDVAQKLGVSAGRVSQLRRQFENDWAVFCYQPALA
jgi:hypothetical protein